MWCPRCQHENRPGAKFCEECATPLIWTCRNCGSQLSPTAKFCPECAHPVAAGTSPQPRFASPDVYTPKHLAEKILTSRSALEGERKQVTVLFTDLKGSMELLGDRDPEEARRFLDPVLERMMEAVHRYEGTVNQVMGDGIMALFGAPLAHEDHAVRACYAALRMQEAVTRYGDELRRTQGTPVQIRVGLNSGEVVVRSIGSDLRMDYTAVGQTTHLAARMEQMAVPGSTLIAANTLRLAEGYVRVRAIGPVAIKGLSKPVGVYELLGVGPVHGRLEAAARQGLSQFVGRATELGFLKNALGRICTGHGEIVAIAGEAGMGKSRLVLEFHRSLGDREVTYLETRCVPYGRGVPFLPILDMLKANCRLIETDTPEAIVDKVRASLRRLDMEAEAALPYLLRLLGVKEGNDQLQVLTPEAINARTNEILWQMSVSGSRRRPLVLVIDDIQWIDHASQQYVASLVDRLPGTRILLVLTYRPGYHQPWMDVSYANRIALRPLLPSDGLAVVRSALRTEALSEPVSQLILERAEGNPLFLEELARAVQEQGGLQPTMAVPDTIQGVLMARIDRLADGTKRVLQAASVLGRDIPLRLFRAVSEEPEAELDKHLRELARLEFLYEQAEATEPAYAFRHALICDVAYASLAVTRRQTLHAATARALERLYTGRLQEIYDRLAYHYARTTEANKAVEYLGGLARKAARAFAHMEAVAATREALVHAERLWTQHRDPSLLELVLLQAHSLFLLGHLPESLDLLLGHRERFEQSPDASLTARHHFLLANTYNFVGDLENAAISAQRALHVAARCHDEVTMGKAHYVLALDGYSSGRPRQGIHHAREAIRLLAGSHEQRWLGQAHWALGINHIVAGDFPGAFEACAHAQAIGDAIEDPRLQKSVAWTTGFVHASMGESEPAVAACQRGLDGSPNPLNTALASAFLGYAHLEGGRPELAIRLLEEAVERMSRFRLRQNHGWFMAFLSEAHLLNDQVDKALNLAHRALEIVDAAKFAFGVGWAQRAFGRSLCASGRLVEADTRLRDALRTFGTIEARFELGRTHLALAELASHRGNREDAAVHAREAGDLFAAAAVPAYIARARHHG
jgi:class 3 adenylate cyclase/tetratricopeptide (TPR) repeat protein